MMMIKREDEEEEEREGLISGTCRGGGGGMAAGAVMVVEYLYSSMSRDLLGKFPDNSAFDFDYTQSTIWSPLVSRHFPSPSFSSSSTANVLQRKLSYDDKMDNEETGVEGGGSDGFWEINAAAEVTVLKKLKENIKNKIGTSSCLFNHFGQINHRMKKKGFDGFSPIPSSSSSSSAAAGAAKSFYDSTTPRKGWANKALKAASRHFKKTMKKKRKKKESAAAPAPHLQISSGLTFPPTSFY